MLFHSKELWFSKGTTCKRTFLATMNLLCFGLFAALLQTILKESKCCDIFCANVCGNMAMSSHNHENVRGVVNKAFLRCLLSYVEYNWIHICLSKDYGLISLLSSDGGGETALIMWCNANRTELTARMSGRETGGGEGTNASCNVIRTRNAYYLLWFHYSISCWCSLFSFRKTPQSLTNVIASCNVIFPASSQFL